MHILRVLRESNNVGADPCLMTSDSLPRRVDTHTTFVKTGVKHVKDQTIFHIMPCHFCYTDVNFDHLVASSIALMCSVGDGQMEFACVCKVSQSSPNYRQVRQQRAMSRLGRSDYKGWGHPVGVILLGHQMSYWPQRVPSIGRHLTFHTNNCIMGTDHTSVCRSKKSWPPTTEPWSDPTRLQPPSCPDPAGWYP